MPSIFFSEQKNGFDKEEVNKYIEKLAAAYQLAYDENQAVNAKYSELLEKYEKLELEGRTGANGQPDVSANIIAKMLLNAELLAQKIIDDAREEAAKALEQTNRELALTYQVMTRAIDGAQRLAAHPQI